MNSRIKSIYITAFFILSTFVASAQKQPKSSTTTFWVAGVCGLCEESIEKAMDVKGVVAADYNLETNKLTVTYKLKKISEERLHQLLNDAGYDTEKSVCSEEQYARVHSCCRYRELEKH